VDAKSGNTGKFHIRKVAGFSFGYGAGVTKAAAAGTDHKSLVSFFAKAFHKAKACSVVKSFCFFDCFAVLIIRNRPDALEDKGVFVFKNTVFHLFGGSAIRRAGVIHSVFSAKVFGAIRAERFVKNNFGGVNDRGVGKTFLFGKGNKHFVCHFFKNLLFDKIHVDFTT
jgi:hypothetical protein